MASSMSQITVFKNKLHSVFVILLFFNTILGREIESMAAQVQDKNGYDNELTAVRSNMRTKQEKPELHYTDPLLSVRSISSSNDLNFNKKDIQNLPPNIGFPKYLNMIKRAPNGFIGMRGKKESEYMDFSNVNTPDNVQEIWQEHDPLWQTGNENDFIEANEWIRTKKTPTTFYGVRGKKYSPELNNVNSILYKLEEDRVRRTLLEDFLNKLTAQTITESEINKRAPTGFTGMRGKRPMVEFSDEIDLTEEKRGPGNAFVGVRGKKDVDHQNFKRSSAEIYRRGKNQRFVDFNNKFVAVRGKKDDNLVTNNREEAPLEAAARNKLYFTMQTLPFIDMHFNHAPLSDSFHVAPNNFLHRGPANVK